MKFLARYPSILAIAIAAWIVPSAFGQSGTLDTSFHPTPTVTPGPPAGYVETNFNTVAAFSSGRGIVVQSDKGVTTRIVIGGNIGQSSDTSSACAITFAVAQAVGIAYDPTELNAGKGERP